MTDPTQTPGPGQGAPIGLRFDRGSHDKHRQLARSYGIDLPDSPEDPAYPDALNAIKARDSLLASAIANSVIDPRLEATNQIIGENARKTQRAGAPAALARKLMYTQNSRGEAVLNQRAILLVIGALLIGTMAVVMLQPPPAAGGANAATKAGTPAATVKPGEPVASTVPGTTTGTVPAGTVGVPPLPAQPTATQTAAAAMSPVPVPPDPQPSSTNSSVYQPPTPPSSLGGYQETPTSTVGYTSPAVSVPQPPTPPLGTSDTAGQPAVALPTSAAGDAAGAAGLPGGTSGNPSGAAVPMVRGAGPLTLTSPAPSGVVVVRVANQGDAARSAGQGQTTGATIVRATPKAETGAATGTPAGTAGTSAASGGAAGPAGQGQNGGPTAETPAVSAPMTIVRSASPAASDKTAGTFTLVRASSQKSATDTAPTGGTAGASGTGPTTFDQVYGNGAAAGTGTQTGAQASGSAAAPQTTAPAAVAAPYRTGQKLRARLETGVSAVIGVPGLPVYARSEDGTLWRGTASATAEKRLNVIFNLAVLPSGQEVALDGAAYDLQTFVPGLAPSVRSSAPTLAQDLINNTLAGFKTFADATLNQKTTTIAGNGTVVVGSAAPDLRTILAGSAAGVFNIPSTSGSFVTLLELPAGAPLLLVVGATGSKTP